MTVIKRQGIIPIMPDQLPEPCDDLHKIVPKKYKKIPRVMVDEITGSAVELTKKQTTFLRHVDEKGVNGAAEFAKISHDLATTTLKLPAVQQYMRKCLWAAGVTDELIAKKIAEGLDATTQKEHVVDGSLVLGSEFIDYEQRGKYIDRAMRVSGLDKPPAEAPAGAMPPGISLVGLTVEDLKTLIGALKSNRLQDATDVTPE